jgi:hypothetical protein
MSRASNRSGAWNTAAAAVFVLLLTVALHVAFVVIDRAAFET